MPLLLLSIYHIVEWLRTTILLVVIFIGVNWIIVWYVTIINTLFGMIVYAFVHMAYFDEEGELCAEVQPHRAMWLMGEIIAFWVTYFFFAFPLNNGIVFFLFEFLLQMAIDFLLQDIAG